MIIIQHLFLNFDYPNLNLNSWLLTIFHYWILQLRQKWWLPSCWPCKMNLSLFSLLWGKSLEQLHRLLIFLLELANLEPAVYSSRSIKVGILVLNGLIFEVAEELAIVVKARKYLALKVFWELVEMLVELAICRLQFVAPSSLVTEFEDLLDPILNDCTFYVIHVEKEFEDSLKRLLGVVTELLELEIVDWDTLVQVLDD